MSKEANDSYEKKKVNEIGNAAPLHTAGRECSPEIGRKPHSLSLACQEKTKRRHEA